VTIDALALEKPLLVTTHIWRSECHET